MKRAPLSAVLCIAASVVLAAPAVANDRFTGLPVYPGAVGQDPINITSTCDGVYHVRESVFMWSSSPSDSPERIATWYQSALGGASIVHRDITSTGTTAHVLEVRTANGSALVTVSRAGPKAVIGLTHISPPVAATTFEHTRCKVAQ